METIFPNGNKNTLYICYVSLWIFGPGRTCDKIDLVDWRYFILRKKSGLVYWYKTWDCKKTGLASPSVPYCSCGLHTSNAFDWDSLVSLGVATQRFKYNDVKMSRCQLLFPRCHIRRCQVFDLTIAVVRLTSCIQPRSFRLTMPNRGGPARPRQGKQKSQKVRGFWGSR